MLKKLILFCIPIVLLSNQFETTLKDEVDWLDEETTVISASRVKENIKKTTASVTIIDEDKINKLGLNSLNDVLNTVAGISITHSNIFIHEIESRGIKDFTSKQILFMIDGHSLDANLLNGGATTSFDNLNLDMVKRIEIIKGPASSLYGANAFTAMVNIITKKASDIKKTEIKSKIGSNDKEANLLFSKILSNGLKVVSDINVKKTNSENLYVKKDSLGNSGYTKVYNKTFRAFLNMEYKDYYIKSIFSRRKDGPYYGAANALTNESIAKNTYMFLEAGYNKKINNQLSLKTKTYIDLYSFDNTWEVYPESYPTSSYVDGMKTINKATNEKKGVESTGTYSVNDSYMVIIGAMFEKHKQYDVTTIQNYDPVRGNPLSSMTDYSNTSYTFAPDISRNMWATYFNNIFDINDEIRLTLGARYDKYNDFGSNFSPRGGISWQANNKNTIKLMYGMGFRAPTFAELYNSSNVINGNSNLKAEEVKTIELSLDSQITNNFNTKVTIFNNDFKDLIVLNGTTYENRDRTNTRGLEFEVNFDLQRGSYINLNYSYVETKDKSTNLELPNISKHKANIIFNNRISSRINFLNHIYMKSKMKRDVSDPRRDLGGYTILNSSVMLKKVYKNLNLKLSVNNVFDKKYYDPSTYGSNDTYSYKDDYLQYGRNFIIEGQLKF